MKTEKAISILNMLKEFPDVIEQMPIGYQYIKEKCIRLNTECIAIIEGADNL